MLFIPHDILALKILLKISCTSHMALKTNPMRTQRGYVRSKIEPKRMIVTFFEPKCKFSHKLTKYHPNMIIWFYTLLTRYLWSILGTSWLYLGPKLTQKEFNLTKLCTKVQFFICCPSPIKTIYIAFFSSYETKMVTILVKLVLFRSKIDQKSVNYDMICVKMQFFYTHYLVIESHFHDLFYR